MSELPRAAVERILSRAAELQVANEAEPGDTISEARLLEIAREVGLDPSHVRQAIAEQRANTLATPSDADQTEGPLLRALGPARVGAQRAVPGTPLDLLDRLDAYFPVGERLTRVRRTPERAWWEPRHDPLGSILRGFGFSGRRYDFVQSDQIVATVTQLDEARCVLRLDSTWYDARRSARTNALAVVVALALFVIGAAIPLMVLGLLIPPFGLLTLALLAIGAVGGAVWTWRLTSRRFRAQIERARVRIEALLDEVEHERLRPPPTVVERILGR